MVVLAAAAPLIAQALRLRSILVLLALGLGPGAIGALDPNALLGAQLISAVVSVAVGIILFDAGLSGPRGRSIQSSNGRGRWPARLGATLGVAVFNAVIAGHAKVDRGIAGFLLSVVIVAGFGLAGTSRLGLGAPSRDDAADWPPARTMTDLTRLPDGGCAER